MLALLSPAKTLDYTSAIPAIKPTQPALLAESEKLIKALRKLKEADVQKLMEISPKLAALNVERFKNFKTPLTPNNARPAIFAFKGDVYAGLKVEKFSAPDLTFAQEHVRMLSGLYGILRPFDLMQPYRLEMGCGFAFGNYKNLYEFWGDAIADHINADLKKQKNPMLINLASEEYFKSVHAKKIKAEIISPQFKEKKAGGYAIVSFFAKKARGMMARYIVQQRLEHADGLKDFSEDRYRYNAKLSTPKTPVFTR